MAFRLAYYLCEATRKGVPLMALSDEAIYAEDDPAEILNAYRERFHPAHFTYLIEEVPVCYLLAKRTVTLDHLAAEARFCAEIGDCRIVEVSWDNAELQRLYLEEFLELAAPHYYDEIADARAAAVAGINDGEAA
jgi:hypothetical protein